MTPEQQALSDKLTQLQRGVVMGVVAGKMYEEAYEKAKGRPAKTPGAARAIVSRMLTDVNVKALKDSLMAEAAEKAIWTRLDSERVLSEIALGQDEQGKTSDRVAAVRELNSMGGWNAATKIAQTDTAGNDVQPVDVNAALVAKLIDKLVD